MRRSTADRARELWVKGKTSGNTLDVVSIMVDCDADAIVYLVAPHGPTCHTGAPSCFFRRLSEAGELEEPASASTLLARLDAVLLARKAATAEKSYAKSLYDAGAPKIGEKLREEADELARAVAEESADRVVSEAADVLFHVMVALRSRESRRRRCPSRARPAGRDRWSRGEETAQIQRRGLTPFLEGTYPRLPMTQKVLVFESDATFAGELRAELQKLGCSVNVVDDGNTGLQQASSGRPDLILLSIELPRMNGFSVCNKLKKDPALKDVPLIIMSSESSDETFEQHRKLRTRAEDYVHKPITFDDLLARIEPFVSLGSGGPVASASVAPASLDMESLDDDEIVIEEMLSKAPPRMSAPPVDHAHEANGNGTASLDAALTPDSAPEPPPVEARRSERPQPAAVDGRTEELEAAVSAAEARIHDLEARLASAQRDAESAARPPPTRTRRRGTREAASAGGGADPEEISRLTRENEELKTRLTQAAAGKTGGVSSREFLDLREALNKKDKEILSFREGLSKKDKEIVDIRERSIALEREKADLDDKVLAFERELADATEKVDALQADKEQAKKAGEDFKRRAARAEQEAEARATELATLKDSHAADLAQRDETFAKEKAAFTAEQAELVSALQAEHEAALTAEREAKEQAIASERQAKEQAIAAECEAKEQAITRSVRRRSRPSLRSARRARRRSRRPKSVA